MKKHFKFGFTLTEILLALAIVGVIASITIPSVVSDTQNRKRAAALGRAVENIETGCQMMIQDMSEQSSEGVFNGHYMIHKDLNGTAIDSNNESDSIALNDFFATAKDYFNVTELTAAQMENYKLAVRNIDGNIINPNIDKLTSSKMVRSQKTGAYYDVSSDYSTQYSENALINLIYIDVNGANSPNKYGLDIFEFGLTDSCHLVPAGTTRVHDAITSIPVESDGCNGVGSSVTNGLSCTSRVVRDGYKINYKK